MQDYGETLNNVIIENNQPVVFPEEQQMMSGIPQYQSQP
jgi:hypothetical protein